MRLLFLTAANAEMDKQLTADDATTTRRCVVRCAARCYCSEQARAHGLHAARVMSGVAEEQYYGGTGVGMELFAHATHFLGFKVRCTVCTVHTIDTHPHHIIPDF